MENRPDQDGDITKSQSAQQPSQKDRSEEVRQTTQGGLDPGNSGPSDIATEQRSDVKPGPATDTGFVGAEGQTDTSGELVEDDDPDFAKGGQGSIE